MNENNHQKFLEVQKLKCYFPGALVLNYEVVATLSGNSQQEQGYKVMQDNIIANSDVSDVFSCNDSIVVGAAQAVKDARKSGATDIYVIGFNADEIAIEAIKAGDMAAPVQQIPYEKGKMTVDMATKLMNGEKITYDMLMHVKSLCQSN